MRWHNVGVQLGSVSNGLADVDLDCGTARTLAPYFLPDTQAVFGRKSTPAAHWLYVTDLWRKAKRAAVAFDDPVQSNSGAQSEHGARLVELRSGRGEGDKLKGALSVFPPSRHPSGERVRWDRDGDPAQVDAATLQQNVAVLAAAALLVRHYPPTGKRHEAALVLGGWLARADWDADRIAQFVEAVAKEAGDAEWLERVNSAKAAVAKRANGENMPGAPRMRQVFGDVIVEALAEWLDVGGLQSDDEFSGASASERPTPRSIDEVLQVFERWLLLEDLTPVYAALGTVAANALPGDPVWLGLVAPPSSAKTEILNATTRLPGVVPAATLTLASLLSGTPAKQQARGAKGGLLRQIGEQGLLVLKDFGSILSMRPDAKNELLAALREIYDGSWTRHLGTDGGKSLSWQGKVGMLFGVTGVIDQHHGVIGAMGDRFLLCRLAPAAERTVQAGVGACRCSNPDHARRTGRGGGRVVCQRTARAAPARREGSCLAGANHRAGGAVARRGGARSP